MAVPVVVILALLFASADPVLGRGRDLLENALGSLEALPRVIFGILAALFAGSAYYGSRLLRGATGFGTRSATARSDIGITERRIVLASAAVVSWVFVLLQLSYLFGTQPAAAGTGVTFADYARRGFGELCVAATGVALLIVASPPRPPLADVSLARRALLWPALALLGAECCVLFSAFHRVTLYESAYGYTRSRVYAQAYMIVTLLVLLALVWHVVGTFDVRRLARQVMTIALATLAVLIFWNGDAWIAGANVNRYAATGKIDVDYLANSLSPDAYPALVRLLPKLPAAERGALVAGLEKHYARNPALTAAPAWYEWNLRRNAARRIHLSGSAAGVATE
jgi:hypothetical protein